MIGTHNSYTYLTPKKSIYKKVTKIWRCQEKTLDEQYAAGARYFDIRVYRKDDHWETSHQTIELKDVSFTTLQELSAYFKKNYKGVKIRLLLDKGDETDFRNEVTEILKEEKTYSNLDFIGAFQNNWLGQRTSWTIYKKSAYTINEDNVYHLPSDIKWWNIIALIKLAANYNIRKKAKQNATITKEMLEDKKIVYLYDYPEFSYLRSYD